MSADILFAMCPISAVLGCLAAVYLSARAQIDVEPGLIFAIVTWPLIVSGFVIISLVFFGLGWPFMLAHWLGERHRKAKQK